MTTQTELKVIDGVLSLCFPDSLKLSPFGVHFDRGVLDYKRRLGGRGGSHLIYKAMGSKKCRILDATAGWCRDAFILASLGCDVTAIEASPTIFELVQDGIQRGKKDEDVSKILERLHLHLGASQDWMPQKWDVIYLDPMFEQKEKRGLNKKESQVLQMLGHTSSDVDMAAWLDQALQNGARVVVKRPLKGPILGGKPDHVLSSGSIRFDIYKGG